MNHAHRPLRAAALLLTIAAGCSKPIVSLTGFSGGDDDPESGTDSTGGPAQGSTSDNDTTGTADTGIVDAPTTGTDTGAEQGGDDGPALPQDDCNADTWMDLPGEQPHFSEFVEANWDPDALAAVDCMPVDDCPVPGPIPGLKTALVVRNDELPVPRIFVPDNIRWLVWSNVELGCADPFGVALCEGQWRASFAQEAYNFCGLTLLPTGYTKPFSLGPDIPEPFIIEVGDADCNAQSFTFPKGAPAHHGDLYLQDPQEPVSYGAPLDGSFCMACEVPGTSIPLIGDFVTTICQ